MNLQSMYSYLEERAGKTIKIDGGRTAFIGDVEPDRIKVNVEDADNVIIKRFCFTNQYVIEMPKDLSDDGVMKTRESAEQLIRDIRDN